MQRPTLIVTGILGGFVLLALVALAMGPNIVMPPQPTTPQPLSVVDMGLSNASSLPVYDVALPEFQGISRWWNTENGQPLTPEALRGKVVLIDFWTYSCINCIRTYPFLRSMHEKYADKGLVIVGVHTPEFEFEKNQENVGREIEKNKLEYPIALDPDYATWNAYHNRYWPAGYLFDKQGRLRRTHFGEGGYAESEEAIRSLLQEDGAALAIMDETVMDQPDFSKIKTPETYFGLERGDAFMGTPGKAGESRTYDIAGAALSANAWNISGNWTFFPEYVQADSPDATFVFNVQASKLHLVLQSSDGQDTMIEIFVDGVKIKDLTINASTLYDIADFSDTGRHTVEIRIKNQGVRFYAATFS